jgi:hypothetical protein
MPARNPQIWELRWHTVDPQTLIRHWSFIDVVNPSRCTLWLWHLILFLAAHSADIHQLEDTLCHSEPLIDALHLNVQISNKPFPCVKNINTYYNVLPYGDHGTEMVNIILWSTYNLLLTKWLHGCTVWVLPSSSHSLNFFLEIIAHTCRCMCRKTQQ